MTAKKTENCHPVNIPVKSDQEVIDFIDSQDALTMRELSYYMVGQYRDSARLRRMWDYVMRTKSPLKLRQRKTEKIYHKFVPANKRADYDNIIKIIKEDPRITTSGKRHGSKMFLRLYSIAIPESTLGRYLRDVRKETN